MKVASYKNLFSEFRCDDFALAIFPNKLKLTT